MAEFLRSWGLVSTHGAGSAKLWAGLRAGNAKPGEIPQANWPVVPNGRSLAFLCENRNGKVAGILVDRLELAWNEALEKLTPAERKAVSSGSLLFASTKGCVEDYIWHTGAGDPYTPVVEAFLDRVKIRPKKWLTVSNACASSHVAAGLARDWLRRDPSGPVAVIAADFVGPFIIQGFHALRALSPTMIRPFTKDRDGLLLGEAAGVAIFGLEGEIALAGAAQDCEGHAVTRPEDTAASLQRALKQAMGGKIPDAVIAHGTATIANDRAENAAFQAVLPSQPLVTGTKGSVGHCLGASGLVDLVAAAEWLSRQEPFALTGCEIPDPEFSTRILTRALLADLAPRRWNSILVSSLGFGGVHAGMLLEKR